MNNQDPVPSVSRQREGDRIARLEEQNAKLRSIAEQLQEGIRSRDQWYLRCEQAKEQNAKLLAALHDVFEMASRQKSNRDCSTDEGIISTALSAVRVIRHVAEEKTSELAKLESQIKVQADHMGAIEDALGEDLCVQDAVKAIGELKAKLAQFHEAMERERKPDWEKQHIELAEKLEQFRQYGELEQQQHNTEAARQLRYMATSFTHKANFVPAELKIKELEGELSYIDSVLSRRPALENFTTRAGKIEEACRVAGKATDRVVTLERERDQARQQVESLSLTVLDLKSYRDRLAEIDRLFGCDHASKGPDDAAEVVRHVRELKAQVESLEKQCGELRTLLRYVAYVRLPLGDTVFDKLDFERQKQVDYFSRPQSTTAGRDYKSPEEYAKLEATVAHMRSLFEEIWAPEQMGWITDGEGYEECGTCGARRVGGQMVHTEECFQGKIHSVLSSADCGKGWQSPQQVAAIQADARKDGLMTAQLIAADVINREAPKYAVIGALSGLAYFVSSAIVAKADELDYFPSRYTGYKALEKQCAAMREALQFYADKSNWKEVIAHGGFTIGETTICDNETFMAFGKGEDYPWTMANEALIGCA